MAKENQMQGTKVLKFLTDNFNFDHKLNDPKRTFVLEGSSGSSKTRSIIQLLILYCQHNHNKNKKITIGRANYSTVMTLISEDFIPTLIYHKMYDERFHRRSNPQSYVLFGNTIRFVGLDDPQKLQGPRQDIVWLNEAMEADEASFLQLDMRNNEATILDFNPSFTTHWIFDTILKNLENKPFVFYNHSTFRDNPFLPAGQRDSILAMNPWHPDDSHLPYEQRRPHPVNIDNGTANKHKWLVYGEGRRAILEGLIFEYVHYIDEFPDDIAFWYGLDFGWTNDPTALVKFGTKGNNLYLQKIIYSPIDHPRYMAMAFEAAGVSKRSIIGADSSDKYNGFEFIKELRRLGYRNIQAISKTKGIIFWINKLKGFNIHIVGKNDMEFRSEQENYRWRLIGGRPVNEPVETHNHLWDASRYALMLMESRKSAFW